MSRWDETSSTGDMASTHTASPQFEAAASFLDAVVAQDFGKIPTALEPDAILSALLPRGWDQWQGAGAISAQFGTWFGDTREYEVADAALGHFGSLLEMYWRLRVRADRHGDEPMVVEQHVYATTAPSGRIRTMRLLCSGFHPERGDA